MHVDATAIRRLLLRAPLALRGAVSKHLTALEQAHAVAIEARIREADVANLRAKLAGDTAAALHCELNATRGEVIRLRAAVRGASELLASSGEPVSPPATDSSESTNH